MALPPPLLHHRSHAANDLSRCRRNNTFSQISSSRQRAAALKIRKSKDCDEQKSCLFKRNMSSSESESSVDLSSSDGGSDLASENSEIVIDKKKIAKQRIAAAPISAKKSAVAVTAESKVTQKRKLEHIDFQGRAAASSSGDHASSSIDITRGPPVTTDAAARKLIIQYFRAQNRPYSAIQIHDNLHKRIPKATLERVLTSLSENDGEIICKEYGKAKIYFLDQNKLASDFTAEQLEQLEIDNEQLAVELEAALAREHALKQQLLAAENEPTDEDLIRWAR
jgi:hypothetical protein